jgi:hypothetical protein
VKNRYRLLELADEHGVPSKKQLKTWVGGSLVVLEVDRPTDELADDLRSRGLIP